MANTWKVINCKIEDAEAHLNENAEEWALHMFLPMGDSVTIVMLSARVLKMQQLLGARGN